MDECAGLHDGATRAVADDHAAFFKLYDTGEDFRRRRRSAVNQDDKLTFEIAVSVRLRRLRLHFLAAFEAGDLDLLVEEIAREPLQGVDVAAGIAAQVQDERLMLSGLAHYVLDRLITGYESRHLPDEQGIAGLDVLLAIQAVFFFQFA